jgi:hypothetical protein
MKSATIEVSELTSGLNDNGSATAEGDPSVNIIYPGEDAATYQCRHCWEELTEYPDGWQSNHGWTTCYDEGEQRHEIEESDLTHASRWLDSAKLRVDGDNIVASVRLTESRGAFTFTVRMMPDGELMLYVPNPEFDNPLQTGKLTEVRPGAYKIN